MSLIYRQTEVPDREFGTMRVLRCLSRGIVALVAFSVLFAWIANISRINIDQPLIYQGDALYTMGYFDHDYIANDSDTRLHAPFELDHKQNWYYLYNALFQSNSNLIWLAHLAGGGSMVRTLNLAYLATFLLVFLSAYWVCGRLGLGNPYRFGMASLYALMPYHFQRSVSHFWESSYYLTPLMALVIMQLWSARPLAHRWGARGWEFAWRDQRAILAVVLIVFLGSFHPYHQFFFAALAASLAPLAALYRKSWRPLVVGLALAVLATAVLLLKVVITHLLLSPELALSINGQAISGYGGAEIYPLKLAQMVLPVQGHRWSVLASIRAMYDAANPLNNENATTTLGLFGSFGLIASVALALVPSSRWRMSRAGKMGMVTLLALSFASMGGISSLISTVSMMLLGPTFLLTQARGWDRIIIFVGFFSYFAAFWLLRMGVLSLRNRYAASGSTAMIAWPVFAFVFAAALWDQVPYKISPQDASHYLSDQRFFGRLESELAPNSRIFQLPFLIHHVSDWVQPGVYYTDALRPYLSSKTLHFTYGGDQGSAQVKWLKAASELSPDQMPAYLCRYGFSGVLLQRNMVKDPTAVEAPLSAVLGAPPLHSDDGDYSFFDIRSYCTSHAISPLDLNVIKYALVTRSHQGHEFVEAGAQSRDIGQISADKNGELSVVGAANEEGWLSFGPYENLRPGRYAATFLLKVTASDPGAKPISLDIVAKQVNATANAPLAFGSLYGTNDDSGRSTLQFVVPPKATELEYRIYKPHGVVAVFHGVEITPDQ